MYKFILFCFFTERSLTQSSGVKVVDDAYQTFNVYALSMGDWTAEFTFLTFNTLIIFRMHSVKKNDGRKYLTKIFLLAMRR